MYIAHKTHRSINHICDKILKYLYKTIDLKYRIKMSFYPVLNVLIIRLTITHILVDCIGNNVKEWRNNRS